MEIVASWTSVTNPPLNNHNEGLNETRLHDSSLFEDLAISDLFHPSKPVIVSDIPKDQRLTPTIRDLLHSAQIQTAAFFPMVTLGNWLGCLLVFFSQETFRTG